MDRTRYGRRITGMVFAGRPSNPFCSFNSIKLSLRLASEK